MMRTKLKPMIAILLASALCISVNAQSKRPITFDDLISFKRVADAQISPDGRHVAYVVNAIDKNLNRGKRSIWIVPAAGGEARQLITSDKNDDTPRWSRDGKQLAFLSTRDGAPQIYVASAAIADGSNPRKVTDAPAGVSEFLWSPDGKLFAFVTEVYPDCGSFNCVARRLEAEEKSKVKAVVADRLLYRHWDSFKRGKRNHLFVVSIEANGSGSEAKDLTPGDFDVPPFSLGDPTAFDFAPDSSEIVFARNTEKNEANSTNNDLFLVSVNGGEAKRITGGNPGSDTTPRYSPDGRWIAYRSQARNGYESDRIRLMLYDRKAGTTKELSAGFDRWVAEILWSPDSQSLHVAAEDRGREMNSIFTLDGRHNTIMSKAVSNGVTLSADGRTIAFMRSSLAMPAEVFKANADGSGVTQLTSTNAALLSQLDLNPAEDFEFDGAKTPVVRTARLGRLKATSDIGPGKAARIHGFIVKPLQFDKTKKYPMVLLIHGGPQGAWFDSWSYRWNAQMWAARGYVTVLINPHGSTGYGQAFTEQISGDWGGAVYEDLMKGVDHVIKPGYVD
ncbi:MAG: S9 family peptidase, partial [Blastocatellia bacterium]